MKWNEQQAEFDKMVEELKDLLFNKGKEYAGDTDALGNFKTGLDIGVSPLQKLYIFLDKHLSSIKSYVKHGQVFSNEPIEGRISDAINYLFLLRCLIVEKKRQQQKETDDGKKENNQL
jgi:hypothetical protein